MKTIRDPIHGDIRVTELELELIDTQSLQKLRRVKQLGTTHLAYPGANHTRFEHSIGAAHLAFLIAQNLKLNEQETNEVCVAALLHDIGHGPLSHSTEEVLEKYTGYKHEDYTQKLIKESELSDILKKYSIDPNTIIKLIMGQDKTYRGRIITSEIDVDRMDYLVRDAHYTGVAYGVIDLERLIHTLEIKNNSLVVTERGLHAAEALLVARFLMGPTVYNHHVKRIADSMLLRAVDRAIEEKIIDPKELHTMDDIEFFSALRDSTGYVNDIVNRIDNRRLFKKALIKGYNELFEHTQQKLLELKENWRTLQKIENELAESVKLNPGYVLIDIPRKPYFEEASALIAIDDRVVSLNEVSPLVSVLINAQQLQWTIGIYSPKEKVDHVKIIAEKFLSSL